MRRRDFIIRLGGAAVAWPRSLIAQSTDRKRRIGVLWGWTATDPIWLERFGAFTQALKELGWADGKNVSFEIRHAVGEPDQPSALAASLVAANVDVIVVTSAGLADVGRKVTSTIPIVAMVIANPLSNAHRNDVIASAAESHIPTIYEGSSSVHDGGLISYGAAILPFYRGAASYVDKILNGAAPGDLPVQQPTIFELAINLRTAKVLGLTVSPTLLGLADEVIE